MHFDHAVILVHNLDAAIADYKTLGFNPFFGGKHADGKTQNALIVFQNGTYLELLAPTDPAFLKTVDPNDHGSFLFLFQFGEGFGGCAFGTQNLEADMEGMRQRGLNINMRPFGGRQRPDGQTLRWRSALIGESMTPFFIQDDTPRELRVPNNPELTKQPNGVIGVAGIRVAVGHFEIGVNRYQAILDDPPRSRNGTAEFRLDDFTVTVVPQADLQTDRLVGLELRASESKTLDLQLTHQAAIELVKSS